MSDEISAPWMKLVLEEEDKVKEIPGPENHPAIVEAHALAGLPERLRHDLTAWCASYAKRAFIKSGVNPDRLSGFKAWARHWMNFGQVLPEFRFGCIMVFERNGPGGDSHVTFGIVKAGSSYVCIGGNQGNQVKRSLYPAKDLLAMRWPDEDMLRDMGCL